MVWSLAVLGESFNLNSSPLHFNHYVLEKAFKPSRQGEALKKAVHCQGYGPNPDPLGSGTAGV